jgi:hypothetical protein
MYAIDNAMKIAAMHHSYESFERSELVMKLKGDLDQLKVRVYSPKNIRKHFLITFNRINLCSI